MRGYPEVFLDIHIGEEKDTLEKLEVPLPTEVLRGPELQGPNRLQPSANRKTSLENCELSDVLSFQGPKEYLFP